MSACCKLLGIGGAVIDGKIVNIAEVTKEIACQSSRSLSPLCSGSLLFIIILKIYKVAGITP